MTERPRAAIAREIPDRRATDTARRLRSESTMPERVLWNRLRSGRLKGLKFRRQQPLGKFTLDFYCHDARLAVEIDGATHGTRHDSDRRRDDILAAQGIYTLRIPASEVSRNVDRVLEWVLRAANERIEALASPHPARSPSGRSPPSPTGEGA
jgi:very-short-patch-repair endonuclease